MYPPVRSNLQVDDPFPEPNDMSVTNVGTDGLQTGAPWGLDRVDAPGARDGEYRYGTRTGSGVRACKNAATQTPD